MDERSTEELVRIALAGGGMRLSASRGVDELVRIALAASNKRAHIVIRESHRLATDELVRIALAGKGCVEFE